jgi:hypothetical protein
MAAVAQREPIDRLLELAAEGGQRRAVALLRSDGHVGQLVQIVVPRRSHAPIVRLSRRIIGYAMRQSADYRGCRRIRRYAGPPGVTGRNGATTANPSRS